VGPFSSPMVAGVFSGRPRERVVTQQIGEPVSIFPRAGGDRPSRPSAGTPWRQVKPRREIRCDGADVHAASQPCPFVAEYRAVETLAGGRTFSWGSCRRCLESDFQARFDGRRWVQGEILPATPEPTAPSTPPAAPGGAEAAEDYLAGYRLLLDLEVAAVDLALKQVDGMTPRASVEMVVQRAATISEHLRSRLRSPL